MDSAWDEIGCEWYKPSSDHKKIKGTLKANNVEIKYGYWPSSLHQKVDDDFYLEINGAKEDIELFKIVWDELSDNDISDYEALLKRICKMNQEKILFKISKKHTREEKKRDQLITSRIGVEPLQSKEWLDALQKQDNYLEYNLEYSDLIKREELLLAGNIRSGYDRKKEAEAIIVPIVSGTLFLYSNKSWRLEVHDGFELYVDKFGSSAIPSNRTFTICESTSIKLSLVTRASFEACFKWGVVDGTCSAIDSRYITEAINFVKNWREK